MQSNGFLNDFRSHIQAKRCFVVGNGPSLKQQDLSKLRGEFVFVVNWFLLHPLFSELERVCYCCSDPHHWNQGSHFHPELLKGLAANSKVTCFFLDSARSAWSEQKILDAGRAFFLQLDFSRPVWKGHFSVDPSTPLNWGRTVIIDFCLPLAYYFGFKEVFLLGCDCDYRLQQPEDLSDSFFYDIDRVPASDLNQVLAQNRQTQSFTQLERWLAGYQVASHAFRKDGRLLANASEGGKLDVLPRVPYKSLF